MLDGNCIYSPVRRNEDLDNIKEYSCKILKIFSKIKQYKNKNNEIETMNIVFYEIEYYNEVNHKRQKLTKNVPIEDVLIVGDDYLMECIT